MQKSAKSAAVVVSILVLAGAGVYAAYVLGAPSDPCTGRSTPTGPTLNATHAPPSPFAPTGRPGGGSLPSPSSVSGSTARPDSGTPLPSGGRGAHDSSVINVVAAENFWGSLAAQLGGSHVSVTSIITDPNTDPHEYQSNDSDAVAFKNAQYIILNNVGYDDWASSLIAADGATNQTILNIGDSLGVHVGGGIVTGNPHLWYNPAYVQQVVRWMDHNLTTIELRLSSYFTNQYSNVTSSLNSLYAEVATIKTDFAGTVVASTESIFVYLANATGLNLITPPAFMEAVAEGNDPPDQSVVTFQCQLESGHVRVLVYNAQTVSPIVDNLRAIAQENNVTVIGVTETIVPPSASFQAWMGGELNALYVALEAPVLGR